MLVIFSAESTIGSLTEEPPIAINQMIFFLSLNDMIVFEKYQVIYFLSLNQGQTTEMDIEGLLGCCELLNR